MFSSKGQFLKLFSSYISSLYSGTHRSTYKNPYTPPVGHPQNRLSQKGRRKRARWSGDGRQK